MGLEQELRNKKNDLGMNKTGLFFDRDNSGNPISASIRTDWSKMFVHIREDYNPESDDRTVNFLNKRDVSDPVLEVGSAMVVHESGHKQINGHHGCPYDVVYHESIINGVSRALIEKDKVGLEGYVVNSFEDVLDNLNGRNHTLFSGQALFWDTQGKINGNVFSKFYETFVKINLRFWGDVQSFNYLKKYFNIKDDEKEQIAESVKLFLDYVKDKSGFKNIVNAYKKEDLFNHLMDKDSWEDLAYNFALCTADLLDDVPPSEAFFGSGLGNPFDKELKTDKGKERVAFARYKAGKSPGVHTDTLEQLDSLYRALSRDIVVETTQFTKAEEFPITYYSQELLESNDDVLDNLDRLIGLGINDKGELAFKIAPYDLTMPLPYKVTPRKFPDFKIALLDMSSSMLEDPDGGSNVGSTNFIPEGNNSKIHYARKGIYGIDNFLRRQQILPYIDSNIILFSDDTRASGLTDTESKDYKKKILERPSGWTELDISVLEKEIKKNSFFVSLSDGEVGNWNGVKSDFHKMIQGTDYVHFQMGGKNTFSKDLESWGVPVFYVRGDDDLSKLMVKVVSSYYKKKTEGELKKNTPTRFF
ncbi:MAG: hypothetical protein KJ583_00975 [Nanoarchaeota archaeon]|nr:hypothetical protein [Nanoarchaeota archaeon]MBU1603863.1 hypothetical protein [Nanoarchaeota archaeon]